jgi:hypothetical protein
LQLPESMSGSPILLVVLQAVTDGLAGGDLDAISALLADDAVWEGLHPGQRCDGRKVIVKRFARSLPEVGAVNKVEVSRTTNTISVTVTATGLFEPLPDGTSRPTRQCHP